jgi:hypothetical protein
MEVNPYASPREPDGQYQQQAYAINWALYWSVLLVALTILLAEWFLPAVMPIRSLKP